MASNVRRVSLRKRGNARTVKEEAEIVVKSEFEDIAACVDVEMSQNDLPGNRSIDRGSIKEEDEDEVVILDPNPPSTSTSPNLHQCLYCSASFTDSQSTLEHIEGHSLGYKSHPCTVCTDAFYSKSELIRHLAEHTTVNNGEPLDDDGDGPFTCPICLRSFETDKGYATHQRSHTFVGKPIKLPAAYLALKQPPSSHSKSTTQISTDSDPNNFVCSFCDSTFETEARLLSHQLLHKASERPYYCTVCGLTFKFQASYVQHKTTAHPFPVEPQVRTKIFVQTKPQPKVKPQPKAKPQPKVKPPPKAKPPPAPPVDCSICRRTFKHQIQLEKHIMTHKYYVEPAKVEPKAESPKAPSPSSLSLIPPTNRGFMKKLPTKQSIVYQKKAPTRTLRSHAGFRCTLCPRTFDNEYKLESHMILHQRKIARKCTACGALFGRAVHRRRHWEEAHRDMEKESDQDDETDDPEYVESDGESQMTSSSRTSDD